MVAMVPCSAAGVIMASEPSWTASFTGLAPRAFGKLVTVLRHVGADAVRRGRPWSPPLEDRALLVVAYWRTNLTMRQLAPLFGVSKSAADRIIHHLGPVLALQSRKRFARDTVLIVDGTLVPTRDHTIADGGYQAPDSSSLTAASAARPDSRPGKRSTTSPTSRPAPVSSTSSPE